MTLEQLKAHARSHGFTTRKVDGEYQIKPAAMRWDSPSVYFTDDIDDAAGTITEWAALYVDERRDPTKTI